MDKISIPKDAAILLAGFGIIFLFINIAIFVIPRQTMIDIASATSIGGSHPLGIIVFALMNLYAAFRFYRLDRSNSLSKIIAIGAAMSISHSFIYICDMCSIPTFIAREGIEVLPRISYLGWIWNHDLGFMRWMGVQLVVLYAYRKNINWKSLIFIIPLMICLAFYTYLLFGFTGMHPFTGQNRAAFFLFSYIPTWYLFFWAQMKFLK